MLAASATASASNAHHDSVCKESCAMVSI